MKAFDFKPETLSRWLDLELGLDVGGVRLLRADEQSHIVVLGDTGSGKSSLFRWLLWQIRKRGAPAIIFDPEREFIPTFYVPELGDVILNATDARMPHWCPQLEIESPEDAEGVAMSLIPDKPGTNHEFWQSAARSLFIDILDRSDGLNPAEIAEACALPLEDLYARLKGSPAASAINPKASQMAESVRGTLMVATRGLRALPAIDGSRPTWSAKAWARNPRGFVFLTSTEAHRDATLPLVTAWLDSLIRALFDRDQGALPVVFIVADEVQTLNRLSKLPDLMTRGRKRSICAILGGQAVSQFKARYGEEAQTLLSQASTKVIYRCSEPTLAEWASKLIGSVEREVANTSVRADISAKGGGGATVSRQKQVVPLVIPGDFQSMDDHQAYFIFRGMVTKVYPRYTRQISREGAAPYVPRERKNEEQHGGWVQEIAMPEVPAGEELPTRTRRAEQPKVMAAAAPAGESRPIASDNDGDPDSFELEF